jgi:choline dehydrogenase-like flavoprotein
MFVDLIHGGVPNLVHADLCIIGGGPAGIAIAKEFANSPRSVIMLESGGLDFDRRIQDLNKGTNTRGDFLLDTSRYRLLGGTTLVWGGWCAPLDETDFERREWVPYSGWPITKRDLLPYYRRAQRLCELGRYRYDVADWPPPINKALSLDPDKLQHRFWQLSPPTRFGKTYLGDLRGARNITTLLNATATELVTAENGEVVNEVRVAGLGGGRTTVRAGVFIVACGGIETARLLLLSNRVESKGVGNRHDLVGRFFMDHPHPDAGGVFIPSHIDLFRPYSEELVDGEHVVLGFGPSRRAQERLRILNSSVAVNSTLHAESSEGWDSLMKLSRAAHELRWPDSSATHLLKVARHLGTVIREEYFRFANGPVRGFSLVARTETAPNPSNRIMLSRERDALGLQRVQLDWSLGVLARVTVEKTMLLLAAELGRLGIGRVRINELLSANDARWSQNLSWYGHHMGTTRMSDNPSSGVVDANCRVHGVANLFVASSAVFPTAGYANPTLTILALSLRLADHVRLKWLSGG